MSTDLHTLRLFHQRPYHLRLYHLLLYHLLLDHLRLTVPRTCDGGSAMPVAVRRPRRPTAGSLVVTVVVVAALACGAVFALRSIGGHDHHRRSCAMTATLELPCGRWWGSAVDQGGGTLRTAVTETEQRTGRRLDVVHSFHRWFDVFPTSSEKALADSDRILFLNWQPTNSKGQRIPWDGIAAGHQDRQIDVTAARLKKLGKPVFVSFSHEPEADVGKSGTVDDFVNAWRHVHDRFTHDGVHSVTWVWTVMGLDQKVWLDRYPALWPGADYVDWVGWDPYNWGACRQRDWRSFAETVHPFYDWLTDHVPSGMPLMLAEYGTVEDAAQPDRKAQWYRDASSALSQFPRLRALVYFDLPHPPANCDWRSDTSSRSLTGFRELARDRAFVV